MSMLSKEEIGEQHLRFVLPDCFDYLLERLAAEHLHPYDINSSALFEDGGYWIYLRYGEGWEHEKKQYFSRDKLNKSNDEFNEFFKETIQLCKKALVADYFKMMKP